MDECNTRENMGVDAFQKDSRPAVPPKSPSLYLTTREPETPSTPSGSPKPFPRSPTLPSTPPTPHYMAPHRGNSLDLPNTDDGSSVARFPVSPRPVRPPPVPPKTKSNVYLYPNVLPSSDTSDGRQTPSPEPHRTQAQTCSVFPRSPTLPRLRSTPYYMAPQRSASLDLPNISSDSVGVERPVSPHPICRPPVPPKTKTYIYLTPSPASDGGQDPFTVSLSSTESELRPTSPTALMPPPSPSQQRSPGPHRTQSLDSEVVRVENSPRSPSPQPPTPAPRTRRIYHTTADIATRSADVTQSTPSAPHHTPAEDTPLLAQVPRIHVMPQQPDEYDTPTSDVQTSSGPTIPPLVPPKTKTRDRPQLTTATTEQYDRPTLPKPPFRPASYSDQHYQAPTGSLDDTNNVHTTEVSDYQAPHSAYPVSEACEDRGVRYLIPPSPVPRDGNSYRSGRSSPSASLQRTPDVEPELYATYQSVIYEPTPSVLLYEPQAMEQTTAPSGGNVSPHPSRPPPPSFSPPPPPAPLNSPLFLRPTGLDPGYSRAYLQVLPGDSGHQISTHGPLRDSHSPSGTLSRSRSEPFLDKDEQDHLSKWRKTMELLDTAPFSSHSRPMTAEEKTQWINQMAQRVRKALTYFQSMLPGRRDTLRGHISELKGIADKLEKTKKRHRVMGTGAGTTGAVGGVAAVVGIALAPLTMGVSLVATAVGTGMAVAAGGVGASSAVKKKKSKSADQKRVEEILRAYRDQVIDLEDSLEMVRTGMEELRRHDLTGASKEAMWIAYVAEAACRRGKTDALKPTLSSANDILKGFDAISDGYYSTGETEKQKKGSENKFATKVSTAAQQLQEGLNVMNCAWETFSLATASV